MRIRTTCALALAFWAKAAYAADFHCPSGDTACLIAAIHAANANGEQNTIFLAAGEYKLTAIDNEVFDGIQGRVGLSDGPNGLPSISGDITIRGPEDVGSTVARDGTAPHFRIFHVEPGGQLTLSWLHLMGGVLAPPLTPFSNRILNGGAILNHGTLTVDNSVLAHNVTFGNGGAISDMGVTGSAAGSRLTIRHSTIRNNAALFDVGGGGVHTAGGSAVIEDTFIHNNGASEGGGGILSGYGSFVPSSELRITRSTIAHNSAFSEGGGIWSQSDTIQIEDSSIYLNRIGRSSSRGAAGIDSSGVMTIVSSTISGNRADSGGVGGIRNRGTLLLRNVTVTGNHSGLLFEGVGGVASELIESEGVLVSRVVQLENSIIALNFRKSSDDEISTPSDCGPGLRLPGPPPTVVPQGFSSLGHNVVGSLADCNIVLDPSDLVADPSLGPFLQDARPGSGHYPLLSGSGAIDLGKPSACTPVDQVGRARFGVCDSGATEFRPISSAGANSLVTLEPLEDTFRFREGPLPGSVECSRAFPGGMFSFTARLTNRAERDLSNLVLQVAELSPGIVLEIDDGRTGGVGTLLSTPSQSRVSFFPLNVPGIFPNSQRSGLDDPPDGRIAPQESVEVPFRLCLQSRVPFRFFVNVFEVSEPDE